MVLSVESSPEDRPSALTIAVSGREQGASAPPQPVRMRAMSLQARALIATSLVIFAFLGLTGLALDRAYYDSSVRALSDRLQSYVWAYLSGSDLSVGGRLILPDFPPEPRFERPNSGLYASVIGDGVRWRSTSLVGRELPQMDQLGPGVRRFSEPDSASAVGRVFQFSEGVEWEVPGRGLVKLTFHVAEDEAVFAEPLEVYRRSLWTWLGAVGAVLLLTQLIVLRWSLTPLRKVAKALSRVERGEAESLPGHYPIELEGLTESLNDFIASEREQRTRYRNTLGDLAHSLKTPLAVMRSELESGEPDGGLRDTVAEQVARMDQIVAYQLSRAATSGHQTFAAPLKLDEIAENVVASLEKVYAEKSILCEFEIDARARFYGEPGDLMELLGNLLENAFKWATHRVVLTASALDAPAARRAGLELMVEDDGPGIPEDAVDRLLQRGVRGDERVKGHGIGLAIVQDIVKAHRGELRVERAPELGGARFVLRFRAS